MGPIYIYLDLADATSRPSHQSEGGVSQRWCENAKWIGRPVLAADWPQVTPTPPSPPCAALMWRARYRFAVGLPRTFPTHPRLSQRNGHVVHLSISSSCLCNLATNMRSAHGTPHARRTSPSVACTSEKAFQIVQPVAVRAVIRPTST